MGNFPTFRILPWNENSGCSLGVGSSEVKFSTAQLFERTSGPVVRLSRVGGGHTTIQ